MNIQLSSKFRQHLPFTVRCQNLQLNIRHEGRQPDICILIELNKHCRFTFIFYHSTTSHSTTSHCQHVITTSHMGPSSLRAPTRIAVCSRFQTAAYASAHGETHCSATHPLLLCSAIRDKKFGRTKK
jgi:hypothetical protein